MRIAIVCMTALVMVGCKLEETATRSEDGEAETSASAEEATPTEGFDAEPDVALSRVPEAELSEVERERLAHARQAKKALAERLMGTLKAAVKDGDWDRGVEVCKTAAPSLTQSVSEELQVEIGRTSFAVRNPSNAPRDWAEPWVEKKVEEDVILRADSGGIRYLSPIQLAEPCVTCHGTAEQIPDDVSVMLSEKYPEDQATGFQPGDLRGYFWVEVAEKG